MNMKVTAFVASLAIMLVATPVLAKKPVAMMNGGGQIVEGEYNVSFGGNVHEVTGGEFRGQLQVNFHNVSNADVVKGRFHSTGVTDVNWYPGSGNCEAAMNVTLSGKFNGEDGWSLIARYGDNEDTARFQLVNPSHVEVYDTYSSGDFSGESNCVGTARTGLDHGDVSIAL